MATLYCSTGSGSIWPGGIVGDLPNPFGACDLTAGQFYTTGDLALGESGEVSGLAGLTIEFWFKTPTPGGVSENLMKGPMTTTGTGSREWRFTINNSSLINFAARSSTIPSEIVAAGTTAIAANTWYHVAGRIDATPTIKIFLNGIEDGSTAWTGQIQAVGATAGSIDTVIGDSASTVERFYDEVAIYRSALTAGRILAHYQAGAQRGFPNGQLPGARCVAALDAIRSPAPRRINAGSRAMWPNFYAGNAALDELHNARMAENVDATTFASKSGELVFLDAAHRSSSPYNTAQMTLGDAGGTEIPYENLGVDYSDATLANEWNVTGITAGTAGITQSATDATSISRYGRRPQSITGVPVGDTDCAAIATAMLAKYKDPILRGTSISLDAGDPTVAEVVFDRDLADRVNVKRTPPGGGARISQDLFIQQIQISGANDGAPWNVTWGLSPL